MSSHDEHVLHTWSLTRDADGDEVSVDLLTDGETVRVDGGDGESYSAPNARQGIEERLLPKYRVAGYRLVRDYPVNDPAAPGGDGEEEPEGADQRPERCPECGTTDMEYVAHHTVDWREGPAWLCTGCKWGQWIVA